MSKVIFEGTQVICPNPKCKVILAVATEDINFGQKMMLDLLEPVMDPHFGQMDKPLTCIKCSEPYVRINGEFKIHTNFGWL